MAENLFNKLRKNTVIDKNILKNSRYYEDAPLFQFDIPILNLALTGSFDGGLPAGILMIAAPPKHFKSSLMIQGMKAFHNKYKNEDHLIVFYDSENGTPNSYFVDAGIDPTQEYFDRRPIVTVESFKSDLANLLNDITIGDKVLICVDSLGMMASDKEMEDAIKGSDKTDMTRAKTIKSTFRIATSQLTTKNIPMIVVNHTYQTMDLYPTEVASGGRGAQYAGHTLWGLGKRQNKEGDEITGHDFIIDAKFSRYVKEKSKFPLTVTYDYGIAKWSGIFDIAFDLGFIVPAKQGWYKLKEWTDEDKSVRRATLEKDDEFMKALLAREDFKNAVEKEFKL